MASTYPLTEQAREMLDILQAHKTWMSRKDLSLALQKEKLTDYRITLLHNLVERGLVDVRRNETASKNPRYEYRAKQS